MTRLPPIASAIETRHRTERKISRLGHRRRHIDGIELNRAHLIGLPRRLAKAHRLPELLVLLLHRFVEGIEIGGVLRTAGVQSFIYEGCDALATLQGAYDILGIEIG